MEDGEYSPFDITLHLGRSVWPVKPNSILGATIRLMGYVIHRVQWNLGGMAPSPCTPLHSKRTDAKRHSNPSAKYSWDSRKSRQDQVLLAGFGRWKFFDIVYNKSVLWLWIIYEMSKLFLRYVSSCAYSIIDTKNERKTHSGKYFRCKFTVWKSYRGVSLTGNSKKSLGVPHSTRVNSVKLLFHLWSGYRCLTESTLAAEIQRLVVSATPPWRLLHWKSIGRLRRSNIACSKEHRWLRCGAPMPHCKLDNKEIDIPW